jgi:hypothetical protein
MTKELQDLAWSILPKEFKEEVKETYREYTEKITAKSEPEYRVVGYIAAQTELELLFGYHNLTSDAEGEEVLTIPRKELQKQYQMYKQLGCLKRLDALMRLFGSKCLPDKETKPAEPKFNCGDRVRIIKQKHLYYGETGTIDTLVKGVKGIPPEVLVNLGGNLIAFHDSDLEPYTEQEEDKAEEIADKAIEPVEKYFDHIINRSFLDHNRLQIAAIAMQGILSGSDFMVKDCNQDAWDNLAKISLACADALIAECGKGGSDD